MDIDEGKLYLTLQDLNKYSIWKFTDVDDLHHPVKSADDFPEDCYDLSIRAHFTTQSGIKLSGYIVGIQNVFSLAIFVNNIILHFNKNLPDLCHENLMKLGKFLDQRLTGKDFSPLKYITDIDLPGFKNIEGEFDLSIKRTDEERLRGL